MLFFTRTIDPNDPTKADLKLIRNKEVKMVAKRKLKLAESLKKGYATIYNQCSDAGKDKLETTDVWEKTQQEQLLHNLIDKIKRIYVGFDDHKQEVFNLVQVLKTLYLYTRLGEKKHCHRPLGIPGKERRRTTYIRSVICK